MAIPHRDIIKSELLSLLASSPDGRLHVRKIYEELAKLHPELTEQEKYDRYKNSYSKWANSVQFARLNLVERGMIYQAGAGPQPVHGVWTITEAGRKQAERSEAILGDRQLEQRVTDLVAEDIASWKSEEEYFEGKRNERLSSFYERNPKLRAAAIMLHGQKCKACGFSFGEVYGEHGDGYIEVHHVVPVSKLSEETIIDPKTEMTVLCSNCHRMIHRKREKPLSIEELHRLLNH